MGRLDLWRITTPLALTAETPAAAGEVCARKQPHLAFSRRRACVRPPSWANSPQMVVRPQVQICFVCAPAKLVRHFAQAWIIEKQADSASVPEGGSVLVNPRSSASRRPVSQARKIYFGSATRMLFFLERVQRPWSRWVTCARTSDFSKAIKSLQSSIIVEWEGKLDLPHTQPVIWIIGRSFSTQLPAEFFCTLSLL